MFQILLVGHRSVLCDTNGVCVRRDPRTEQSVYKLARCQVMLFLRRSKQAVEQCKTARKQCNPRSVASDMRQLFSPVKRWISEAHTKVRDRKCGPHLYERLAHSLLCVAYAANQRTSPSRMALRTAQMGIWVRASHESLSESRKRHPLSWYWGWTC